MFTIPAQIHTPDISLLEAEGQVGVCNGMCQTAHLESWPLMKCSHLVDEALITQNVCDVSVSITGFCTKSGKFCTMHMLENLD